MYNNGLVLLEMLASNNMRVQIAKAILDAQDIQEGSWDKEAGGYLKKEYVSAEEAVNRHIVNNEKMGVYGNTSYKQRWVYIIHAWNVNIWNDIQWYAQDVLIDAGITEFNGRPLRNSEE